MGEPFWYRTLKGVSDWRIKKLYNDYHSRTVNKQPEFKAFLKKNLAMVLPQGILEDWKALEKAEILAYRQYKAVYPKKYKRIELITIQKLEKYERTKKRHEKVLERIRPKA
ncbi:MAG: hypothetical protein V1847_02250 [Candidatus Diapherotrites archaeon]